LQISRISPRNFCRASQGAWGFADAWESGIV